MRTLEACLAQAEEFRRSSIQPSANRELQRIHNAIFVDGDRGVGKTAFMLSLEQCWGKRVGDRSGTLHFFAPVDPTLLETGDNFLNIIVAHIYRKVAEACTEKKRQDFWRDFEAVGEALEAGANFNDQQVRGAERILAARDHGELEIRLYSFFESACEILGVKALVVLIDDVDMSLTKGFHVLDVVRRYMACPLVIPVVSGDIKLYEILVASHFADELGVKDKMKVLSLEDLRRPLEAIEAEEGDYKGLIIRAQMLSLEYLKKVLPLHQRVQLKLIPDLLLPGERKILVKFGETQPALTTVLDQLARVLAYNVNGVEDSRPALVVNTARELVQLLLQLTQKGLAWDDTKPRDNWTSREQRLALASAMGQYWRNLREAALHHRSLADQAILSPRSDERPTPRLSAIPFFDPVKHPAKDARYQIPIEAVRPRPQGQNRDSRDRPPAERPLKAMMPMPSYESAHPNMIIVRDEWKTAKSNDQLFGMHLLTHTSYYSSGSSRASYLFFGRAFEIVISSMLGCTDSASIEKIIRNPPYLSNFHYFPTKPIDGSDLDSGDEADDGSMAMLGEDVLDGWSGRLEDWYSKHEGNFKETPPSAQMIYKVLNKCFNQINIYKQPIDGRSNLQRTLETELTRLKLILMNAFASFEKDDGRVVLQNFALGALDNIYKDNSWSINVSPLIERGQFSFTKAISTHPLFDIEGLDKIQITGRSARPTIPAPPKIQPATAPSSINSPSTSMTSVVSILEEAAPMLDMSAKARLSRVLRSFTDAEGKALDRMRGAEASNLSFQLTAKIVEYARENRSLAVTLAAHIYKSNGYAKHVREFLEREGRLPGLLYTLLYSQ